MSCRLQSSFESIQKRLFVGAQFSTSRWMANSNRAHPRPTSPPVPVPEKRFICGQLKWKFVFFGRMPKTISLREKSNISHQFSVLFCFIRVFNLFSMPAKMKHVKRRKETFYCSSRNRLDFNFRDCFVASLHFDNSFRIALARAHAKVSRLACATPLACAKLIM